MNCFLNFGLLVSKGILIWKWFRVYLTSRMQCVTIGSSISAQLPIIFWSASRQYSRPSIVFNIWEWSSSIIFNLKCLSLSCMADDTKCLKPVCNISDCLSMQIDLHNLTTWSQHCNLNFNAAKCALLQFSSGCPPTAFNYILNGDLISAQETHRDLGIIVSSDLSWREHMNLKYSIHSIKTLNLIRCSFSTGHSPQAKKILYLYLVHSQLTYCSQIWHPHLLKKIQRRARENKYILNDFTSDYRSRLIALKILQLELSSWNMFCQELTLQDIFTSTEFLDYGTLYLPLT